MRASWLLIIGLVAACHGSPNPSVEPSGGPGLVASAFMRAVADSNLRQMGELWGTSKGSAAATNTPADWQRRVTVMQLYLRGGPSKVSAESRFGGDRQEILVELSRPGCVKQVPFTMIRTKDGSWLVNSIDLNAAGNPAKPCDASSTAPTPRQ